MSKNLKLAAAVAALCVSGSALADTVTYNLSTLAQWTTPSAPTSGSAVLTLADAGAGLVKVTLAANLTGTQTLTGLWLEAPGYTDMTVGTSPAATPVTAGLTYHPTADLTPQGQVNSTGKYDLKVTFPNGGNSVLQGSATEVFYLAATGLSTAAFVQAVQAGNGQPNPDFYAMMGVTNAAGTASGLGYWGATTPVPLPAALPLLLAGLGGMGGLARRRLG